MYNKGGEHVWSFWGIKLPSLENQIIANLVNNLMLTCISPEISETALSCLVILPAIYMYYLPVLLPGRG